VRRQELEEAVDNVSFDRLARVVSEDASRRGVLRSAFAAAVAGLGITALLSPQEAAAKSCQQTCKKKAKQHDWSKKKKQACLKKCTQQDTAGNPQGGMAAGKAAGTLCATPGECAAPNTCDIPVNDSGGDKRCCAPTGAPCGLKTKDGDDTSPFCCRGNTCTSTETAPGTCQLTPEK
jgi:hypothetical protein